MDLFKDYGVTIEGFKRMRLPEIKKLFEELLAAEFGVPIEIRPDSVLGQLIGVISFANADLFEALEQVYYAMYPGSAEGTSLDYAVFFGKITRLEATQTAIITSVFGNNGTAIPANSLIMDSTNDEIRYRNLVSGQISLENTNRTIATLPQYISGQTVSITIADISGHTNFTYLDTEDTLLVGTATPDYVLFRITEKINAAGIGWQSSNLQNQITLTRSDLSSGSALSFSTHFVVGRVWSPLLFTCEDYGSITPLIGNVTRVVTSIVGWDGVVNELEASVGLDRETDEELRLRYRKSASKQGSTSTEAIQARIRGEVENVTAVVVYENDTDEIDGEGRPPHTMEAIVAGGLDGDIAKVYYRAKSGGIGTFGDIGVIVADSQSIPHMIRFNRPQEKKIWLKVEATRNLEDSFSANTPERIKEIIVAEGLNSQIGMDIVLQKFYGPIYRGTQGIAMLSITAAIGDIKPPNEEFSPQNVIVGVREVASFIEGRIEVGVIGE